MFLCSILPRLPDEQKWAFSFLPPPKFEVDARYEYLKNKTDIRKVGILGDPSPYGTIMRNIAVAEAKNFGIDVVANESYQQDDADFSVQIGRINAAGAGAIIMIGQGNAVITTSNNIKQLGLNKLLLLASINERDLVLAAGKILGEQFMFPAPLIQVAQDDPDVITNPATRAAADAFFKRMKAKFGDIDPAQSSRAWDSIMMMAKAMEMAKTTEGTAVRDAFEKIGHYDGAGASYDFSVDQHVGVTKNPYAMAHIVNGKIAFKK
jgi:ABC-type branched-subunit amino acid transport system substrate-binding protein